MKTLPDFIIIGAMKSATSSLYDQLVSQPGIYMTVPKEPNYFSDDDQYIHGQEWYSSLFSPASETDLVGEASTHYTKLPTYPNTIQRMLDAKIQSRFIYVMRHPIDRLISHYIHEWTQGVMKSDINSSIKEHPELLEYSLYTKQLEPYMKQFGKENILPVFFDRLKKHPQDELENICNFIGYKGRPEWQFTLKPSNVSRERIRKFPLYRYLVDSNIATWVRRKFIPKQIRNRIKNNFRMQERPIISNEVMTELKSKLNEDLNRLGNMLGIDLNCENFSVLTENASLEWKDETQG